MKKHFLVLCLLFSVFHTFGNVDSTIIPQVRFSPTMISNLSTTTNKYVKVTYGQPFKKNRVVFGGIVPYGQLWRTGANEATEITVNQEFVISNKVFDKGTYTLYSIPNKNAWEIIINKKVGQWGTLGYDSTQNLIQFKVPVIINKNIYEGFTIELNEKNENTIDINMMWDDVLVSFPIVINRSSTSDTSKKKKKGLFRR
jgi:hypothetical protein